MTKVNAYIRPHQPYSEPIRYTLRLIAQNASFDLDLLESPEDANWTFDHDDPDSESIAVSFYERLRNGNDDRQPRNGLLYDVNDQVDELASIFYMVNCIQEQNTSADKLDQYGRFKFSSSYQAANGSILENIVQQRMEAFLSEKGIKPKVQKSKVFISHDVDFLYSSIKEDLKWAAKNWRIGDLLKIISNEVIGKPHARNIDKVIQINSEYDIRSTFFWMVNKGFGSDHIPNADYSFSREQDLINLVYKTGGWNGLHKSANTGTIADELKQSAHPWKYNRHHYLRFQTHDLWQGIASSRIKLDCSLGFAERIGFRNSYGRPFTPYDLKNDKPYDFVEMPLHVMDATFLHYMKTDSSEIAPKVIDFIEKHKENCVLSILWHNNYLTDYSYRGYLDAYKSILCYIHDTDIQSIAPDDIIDQYLL